MENLNDEYFWFYANYGSSLPHAYNIKERKEEDNPRSTDQAETIKHLFALYTVHSCTLYLSNFSKKSWLAQYLREKLENEVIIKNYYKNPEEFLQHIKHVEILKLVARNNLFSAKAGIMEILSDLQDIFGLGVPADFTLEANFSRVRLTNAFVEKFKQLARWKSEHKAESLLCIGRDDKGIETVFNVDNFIEKLYVDADKNKKAFITQHPFNRNSLKQ